MSRYISRNVSWFTLGCFHNIHYKASTFHGTLCLINSLEDAGISIAFDHDWHTHILKYIQGSQFFRQKLKLLEENKGKSNEEGNTEPGFSSLHPQSNQECSSEEPMEVDGNTRSVVGTTGNYSTSDESGSDDEDWYTTEDEFSDDDETIQEVEIFDNVLEMDGSTVQRFCLIEESIMVSKIYYIHGN